MLMILAYTYLTTISTYTQARLKDKINIVMMDDSEFSASKFRQN